MSLMYNYKKKCMMYIEVHDYTHYDVLTHIVTALSAVDDFRSVSIHTNMYH